MKYTVQRVEDERVIIADDHRSYSLPKAALEVVPKPGDTVSIAIQAFSTEQPLTTPLAHELLNELLAHSS